MAQPEYLKDAFNDSISKCIDPRISKEWARLGLHLAIIFIREIRSRRYQIPRLVQNIKEDGSPATLFEEVLEMIAIEKLKSFYPLAGYIGEESGDLSDQEEYIMILDPIDGTRSFLSGLDSYSVTLSFLRKKEPIFSLICNPATGDVIYVIENETTQLFQILDSPEKILVYPLPLLKDFEHLINIHPSKKSLKIINTLYDEWGSNTVKLVRSVSGSPSLMLADCAKGCGSYINGWSGGKTNPFDLLPGFHILTRAGGFILNAEGKLIDPWNHSGLFLAGLNYDFLQILLEKIKN